MPEARIDSDLVLYYEDDCFVDPWKKADAVLLLHGGMESSRFLNRWIPVLAREFRVIRPDLRGHGRSSVPREGYRYSPVGFAADLDKLLVLLGVEKVHAVGVKIGGSIALQLAADFPHRVRTVAAIGPLLATVGTGGSADITRYHAHQKAAGKRFASDSQGMRLGSGAPPEQVAWYSAQMAMTNETVRLGLTEMAGAVDLRPSFSKIRAPVLIGTSDKSPLASIDKIVEWQRDIADSELFVLPYDGYHLAAVRSEECARVVLDFIARRGGLAHE